VQRTQSRHESVKVLRNGRVCLIVKGIIGVPTAREPPTPIISAYKNVSYLGNASFPQKGKISIAPHLTCAISASIVCSAGDLEIAVYECI
jgi:hypothetical protein